MSHRMHAVSLATMFAALVASGPLGAQSLSPALVAIPTIPTGAVCADEKTRLIERAAAANTAAAENAQVASRAVLDRQPNARTSEARAELDRLRRERDRRAEEWRRAEAAYDEAVRLDERDCSPPRTAAPAEPVMPAVPPAAVAAVPVPRSTAPVSLALSIEVPGNCRGGSACPISVAIENRGTTPMASPVLAALSLGFDGGTSNAIAPESWACSRGGEQLTCTSTGVAVQPGERTRFTVDWRLPERLRRPSATVCAAIVWPGAAPGGVYRSEQIAAVQFALTRAGFDTGGVTGRIGPRTMDAIRALRGRAGIQGGTGVSPDLTANLFGANSALTGDDDAQNDRACGTVSFSDDAGAPIAAAPAAPPAPRAQARPRQEGAPAPRPQARAETTPRRQVRRPPPRVVEDDEDDDVTVYTTRRPPVVVYRRVPRQTTYYYYSTRPWGWGPPVIYRPW